MITKQNFKLDEYLIKEKPKDWQLSRFKFVVKANQNTLPETTAPDLEIEYVDIGSVDKVKGITTKEKLIFENAPSRARRIVKSGDIIISTVRTYLQAIASIDAESDNLIVSTGFTVITPSNIENSYAAYFVKSEYFIHKVMSLSVGVSYPAINPSKLLSIYVLIPSLIEQRAIAAFLDRETSRIDALIEKKKRLIALLAEKRTALITRAVTKGINPSAKMKPSGIDWLGEIPAHWEVKKLKQLSIKIGDGIHATPEYADNGSYYFVNGNNIKNRKIQITERTQKVDEPEYLKYYIGLSANSILLSLNGTIGNLAFYNKEKIILGKSAAYVDLKPNVNREFILYYLSSDTIQNSFNLEVTGSTIKNLSLNSVRNTIVLLPSEKEQLEIVNFISSKLNLFESTIEKTEISIEKLHEYRTALISAAVTGKIKVGE